MQTSDRPNAFPLGETRFILERVLQFLRYIDTPKALALTIMLRNHEYEQAIELTLNPHDYTDPDLFSRDLAVTSIIRKMRTLPLSRDRTKVALDGFLHCEERGKAVNRRWEKRASSRYFTDCVNSTHFEKAKSLIARVLGQLEEKQIDEILSLCRFGPGSTFTVKGPNVNLKYKLGNVPECTKELHDYSRQIMSKVPFWHAALVDADDSRVTSLLPVRVVCGNRVTFVEKNAKTKRSIGIEPGLNICLQLGIGTYMKQRLRRFGINLLDQTRNQRLAREGSVTGELATLDLKNASNSLYREVVRALLPPRWYALLNMARSHSYQLGTSAPVPYEMFSSMGNGFTFELESLIFWALVKSTGTRVCGIYGDDIVCDTSVVNLVRDLLAECGFELNGEKSFHSSYFRESCGGYYFRGVTIKPPFIQAVDSFTIVALHNRIWDFASCEGPSGSLFLDPRYSSLLRKWGQSITHDFKCDFVPRQYGDGGPWPTYFMPYKVRTLRVLRSMSPGVRRHGLWSGLFSALNQVGSEEFTGGLYNLRGALDNKRKISKLRVFCGENLIA